MRPWRRHHGAAAGSVQREQLDAEVGGGGHGVSDGARDVVVLEVEEDAPAAVGQGADQVGARAREEGRPDLVEVDGVREAVHEVEGLVTGRNVQRNNDL
jgi:hypothetical protein